ncbi:hypothetical protein LZ30DRAFT_774409 [Colletotrichum cereale]|nr:hypothetical protein LZ30DRAFT_774409 [Colletotrichum cereale]
MCDQPPQIRRKQECKLIGEKLTRLGCDTGAALLEVSAFRHPENMCADPRRGTELGASEKTVVPASDRYNTFFRQVPPPIRLAQWTGRPEGVPGFRTAIETGAFRPITSLLGASDRRAGRLAAFLAPGRPLSHPSFLGRGGNHQLPTQDENDNDNDKGSKTTRSDRQARS